LDVIANNALDVPFLIAFIAKDGGKFKAANHGEGISPAAKWCACMQQVEDNVLISSRAADWRLRCQQRAMLAHRSPT
jgi:hypothetical protein